MNSASSTAQETAVRHHPNRRAVITLLLLAPVIAEVLSGATRISYIFVLIPEIMVWGVGALIIRDLVRRWNAGGTSMLLLGLALSVAEEFIIQQTSLAPLPWLGSAATYGREWGVNWIYFLYMLGYESVWVVLVPVQVTELIFPDRRDQCWLRIRGLIIAGVVFLFGSFIAWFAWTQRARPMTFHVPPYHPSAILLITGLCAIVFLAVAAYLLRGMGRAQSTTARAPSPWIAGIAVLVMGFPWYLLMALVFTPTMRPHVSFWIPMAAGLLWAVFGFVLFSHWSSTRGWSDMHRWSLVFSATLVNMIAGFLGSSIWPRVDVIGKVILNVVAVIGFLYLARTISRRQRISA